MLIQINTYIVVYGIELDLHPEFSLPDGSVDKNVIIFGVEMSPSVHINRKVKDTLLLATGPTQGLGDTTLTAEVQYSIK